MELELALADVVADAVAGDVVEGIGLVHILARRADDGGEFDLVVGFLGTAGDDDRIVGTADRARGLHEQHGLGRHVEPRLRRMIGIVEADGHDLADAGHGWTQPRASVDPGQRGGIERLKPCHAFREQDIARDVVDFPGKIADAAIRIDQAGFFLSRGTIANQFDHSSSCAFAGVLVAALSHGRPLHREPPLDTDRLVNLVEFRRLAVRTQDRIRLPAGDRLVR